MVRRMEDTSASRLRRSCRSISFDVPIISIGTAFSASVGDTSMEGAWITSGVRITPPDHPAVAEWLAALKQYVPGTTPVATGGIGSGGGQGFGPSATPFPETPPN